MVVTSSYEARALGVKTGMNVVEAKRAYPGLILVRAHHENIHIPVMKSLRYSMPLVRI